MPAFKDPSGRWRFRFSYLGKRYSGSAPTGNNTKKAAEALEKAMLERLASRRFTGVMPTVKEFVKRFLEHQGARVKPLTLALHTTLMNLHVVPVLGHQRLDAVGASELAALATSWRTRGDAITTVNTRMGTVQTMFGLAVDWGFLLVAPKIVYFKVPKETVRFLTEVEAVALLDAAKPKWRSMVLIGLRTGMRIGELRGLQWGDIDLDKATLVVRRTDPGLGGMDSTVPKGGRFRFLPLTADARACLAELHADARAKTGHPPRASDWVWPGNREWHGQHERHRPRAMTACNRQMREISKRAKVDDCTWHTLRHTFASWLVMRGVSLRVVQELLGHQSIRMTERYAHLAPGFAQHAAVASLEVPLAVLPALPEIAAGLDDRGEE